MASVVASGGYYVACASDRIFANRTITGSIGVIAQWYNYGDLCAGRMQDVVIRREPEDAGSGSPMTKGKAYFRR